MSFRRIFSVALASLLTVAAAGFFNPAEAGSMTFTIDANTSSLVSGPGGLIDLALSPMTPPGSPTVSMSVSVITTDGTLGSVNLPNTGTAAGDLFPGDSVTANNTAYSDLNQNFSVGTILDLSVTLSGSGIGAPDSTGTGFYFTLYDVNNNTETATLVVNPDGSVGFSSSSGVTVIPPTPSVPEPSSVVLLGLGLGIFAVAGRYRNRRAA